jgi:protein-S-isoprenylcysteine O-methyltransferase Ste14
VTGPIIKTLIFTVLVPGTVTVLLPRWLLGRGARLQWPIGMVPLALGALIYLRCAWDFATAGRGTPAPIDPPKKLVARGLYRFVRNPMYWGVLLVVLGESVLFASAVLLRYAVAAWFFFHCFVVLYEEPALHSKFGPAYEEYRKDVPRWIPRFRRLRRYPAAGT